MRECLSVYCEWCFTCEGDFLSCRLGLTLRKPLAASDELLASPFLRPSVALCDRQESEDKFSNFTITNVFWVCWDHVGCFTAVLGLSTRNHQKHQALTQVRWVRITPWGKKDTAIISNMAECSLHSSLQQTPIYTYCANIFKKLLNIKIQFTPNYQELLLLHF